LREWLNLFHFFTLCKTDKLLKRFNYVERLKGTN